MSAIGPLGFRVPPDSPTRLLLIKGVFEAFKLVQSTWNRKRAFFCSLESVMNTAKRNVSVNVKGQHCALDGVFKASSGYSINTTNREVLNEEVSVSYVRTVCESPGRR